MDELFQINRNGNVILHPEALKLTRELKKLKGDVLRYILLAYSYKSPYKQYPKDDRIRKAKREVYGKDDVDPEKELSTKKGIDEFMSLQYDPQRETIESYKTKVAFFNNQLLEEMDAGKVKKYTDAITLLNEEIKKIQREIEKNDVIVLKGGNELSLIEQWQLNQKAFKKDQEMKQRSSGIVEL